MFCLLAISLLTSSVVSLLVAVTKSIETLYSATKERLALATDKTTVQV
jgi:hypothetical protein